MAIAFYLKGDRFLYQFRLYRNNTEDTADTAMPLDYPKITEDTAMPLDYRN